jgi:hypothetical protein
MKAWKIRKFAGDVVYDLRARGLLPVAILLLVGMVALPFVIGRAGGDTEAAVPSAQPSAADAAPENQAAVVAYEPGLRDYRERLSELPPKNPFRQQFTSPAAGAASTATAPTDGSGATVVGGDPTGGGSLTPSPVGTGGGSTGGGGTRTTRHRYWYYETDVVVGEVAAKQKKLNRVTSFTYLPNLDTPVVSYIGAKDRVAVFLVSEAVVGIEGAPDCAPSVEECQLIGLGEGETARLTYGPNGKTYSLQVTRVEYVSHKKPRVR